MKKTLLLISAIALLFTSCSKELDLQPDANNTKASVNKLQNAAITNGITKFVFTKEDNPGLIEDAEGVITDNMINVTIYADAVSLTNLKPTITYNGEATINPLSGVARDFTRQVMYSYYNTEFGTNIFYKVKVTVKPAAAKPKLYISGYFYVNDDLQEPCYWANGDLVKLTSSSKKATTRGIVVKDNDVYVAGTISVGYPYLGKAVYWKNGQEYSLSNEFQSSVDDITIYGNDVYILGQSGFKYVYWKNGVEVVLDNSFMTNKITFKKIIVDETGVHIVGSQSINNEYIAFYWKNGIKTILNPINPYTGSSGYSFNISNSNVYVFGSMSNTRSQVAASWKNGVLSDIPHASIPSFVTKVFNEDIYSASSYPIEGGTKAIYWKNGVLNNLEISTYPVTIAEDILVSGSDVYLTGRGNASSNWDYMYWINDKLKVFSTDQNTRVTGMFVNK
jgi:hypothetical protein